MQHPSLNNGSMLPGGLIARVVEYSVQRYRYQAEYFIKATPLVFLIVFFLCVCYKVNTAMSSDEI